MKNRLVTVPSIRTPIADAPGFRKKGLADYKLDLMALCGFGCAYCSSNEGNYLRINREGFADRTEAQLGERLYPATSPELTMVWPDVIEKLEALVRHHAKTAAGRGLPPWGTGMTLVLSMLTDAFSPVLVGNGTTEAALRLVLEHTGFRIRVLTKNAVVGSDRWRRFFAAYPGRFVVGLSCGTLDGGWARTIEVGTSSPAARAAATRLLQDAGVPTFAMFCPVFPDAAAGAALDGLVAAFRPERCETVWAEPYNDRANWRAVRAGYDAGSAGWQWLTDVYGNGGAAGRTLWSAYATELYTSLMTRGRAGGWAEKLHYLLYEDRITAADAPAFRGFAGVLLQGKPVVDGARAGYSANDAIAALQAGPQHGRVASAT